MSVTYVGSSGQASNGTTTLTVAPPTGTSAGDIILALSVCGNTSSDYYQPPSGWTVIGTSANLFTTLLAWHEYAAGETSYTFTNTVSANGAVLLVSFSGPPTSSPIDQWAFGSQGSTSSTDVNVPTVTTTGANEMIVALAACTDANSEFSFYAPSGVTAAFSDQYVAISPNGSPLAEASGYIQAAAGATPASGYNVSSSYSSYYQLATVAFLADAAPSAPTLVSPANNAYEDLSGTPTFTWQYNNIDGTTQADWAFERTVNGGALEYWSVASAAWETSIVWNSGSAGSYTFPAGAWANGSAYTWSVNTESSAGLTGVFATPFNLTGQAPPTCTVTGPSGTVTSTSADVTWTETPASGASITAYQLIVYTQAQTQAAGFAPGSGPYFYSSGVVAGTATSQVVTGLALSTAYVAYVQVEETGGQWSAWAAGSTFTVKFDPPAVPLLTATYIADQGATALAIQGEDNLLSAVDSSLETGLGTWAAGTNWTITQSSAEALDGSYSMLSTRANTTSGNGYATINSVPITASTTYFVVVGLLGTASTNGLPYNVKVMDQSGTVLANPAINATESWQWAVIPVTTLSTSTSLQIFIADDNQSAPVSGQTIYFDEIGVFPAASATPNLVYDSELTEATRATNPSWRVVGTIGTAPGDMNVISAGTAAAAWVSYGTGSANGFLYPVSQPIIVTPGSTYTLSGYLDSRAASGGTPVLSVFNTGVSTSYATVSVADGTEGPVSVTFTVPAGVTEVVIIWDTNNAAVASGSSISASQIQLTETATAQPYTPGPLWTYGGYVGSQTVTVESSDDGGNTWQWVRGGSAIALPSPGEKFTLYDYEGPAFATRQYRAIVASTNSGAAVQSAWSFIAEATASLLYDWYKNPLDPNMNMAVSLQFGATHTQTEMSQTYKLAGRPLPVIIADTIGGMDGTDVVITTSDAAYQQLSTILAAQAIMLRQTIIGQESFYVRLGVLISSGEGATNKSSVLLKSSPSNPVRNVSVSYLEVTGPPITS